MRSAFGVVIAYINWGLATFGILTLLLAFTGLLPIWKPLLMLGGALLGHFLLLCVCPNYDIERY